MTSARDKSPEEIFRDLGPDQVLNLVEQAADISLTNLFRPLNSYINRVFELERSDGAGLIVKFYRPGRWNKETIIEEHQFLLELAEAEVPVIPPLSFSGADNEGTLGLFEGVPFALFEKKGGRSVDEFNDDQWEQLGRLIGRVHSIGSVTSAPSRPSMSPLASTRQQLDYLMSTNLLSERFKDQFSAAVMAIIAETAPLFEQVRLIRIHGDCHFSNIIHRPGESFYLIDFDDMVMGPPIQDIWMLLPGSLEDAFVEMDIFLEGYETFHPFDRRSFNLIEPLRAMRFIHYITWCGYQVAVDGHTRVIPDFGTDEYWQREIEDLYDQLERIKDTRVPMGNC